MDRQHQTIAKTPWLSLYSAQWQASGDPHDWYFVSRKDAKPALDISEAVIIVPVHVDGSRRRLVVCKEWRVPIWSYEYSFSGGLMDVGESAEEAAARELREETGLTVTKVILTSPVICSASSFSDETFRFVICECVGEPKDCIGGTESIQVQLWGLADIAEKLSGIADAPLSAKIWVFLLTAGYHPLSIN